jgi:hypothetical protein
MWVCARVAKDMAHTMAELSAFLRKAVLESYIFTG